MNSQDLYSKLLQKLYGRANINNLLRINMLIDVGNLILGKPRNLMNI